LLLWKIPAMTGGASTKFVLARRLLVFLASDDLGSSRRFDGYKPNEPRNALRFMKLNIFRSTAAPSVSLLYPNLPSPATWHPTSLFAQGAFMRSCEELSRVREAIGRNQAAMDFNQQTLDRNREAFLRNQAALEQVRLVRASQLQRAVGV
jgi:hypothetical protein